MKSKDRVQDLAEVYTNAREVVAMLDLVKDVRYDSTFLEPGCGNGNFIVEILSRKFKLLKNLQEVKQLKKVGIFDELEFRLLLSVASIYGIDIDEENIDECKARMFSLIEEFYTNDEEIDLIKFNDIGIVKNKMQVDQNILTDFQKSYAEIRKSKSISKEDFLNLYKICLPSFIHEEKQKFLDDKM